MSLLLLSPSLCLLFCVSAKPFLLIRGPLSLFYEASTYIETSGAQSPMPLVRSRTNDSIVLTDCMHVVQLLRMEGGADAVNQAVAVAVAARDAELAALQRHAGRAGGPPAVGDARGAGGAAGEPGTCATTLSSWNPPSAEERGQAVSLPSASPHSMGPLCRRSGALEHSGEGMLAEPFQDWQELFRTKEDQVYRMVVHA